MLITSYGIVCMILIENSMHLKSFSRPSDSGADLLSSVPAGLGGILGNCYTDWLALNRSVIAVRRSKSVMRAGK